MYRLFGHSSSPYSMKLRAVMRYRRLSHIFIGHQTPEAARVRAAMKPPVIPILEFPEDGSLHNDSTPLIFALEARHPERGIVPEDSGTAFLAHLIEDMADEWLTKAMFHYRWFYEPDRVFASRWIIVGRTSAIDPATLAAEMAKITARQVSRMHLVGCTEENRPLIEDGFLRILEILEGHLQHGDFLFGTRPSLAEFGLFGQLYPLARDPTPMEIMRQKAPGVYEWVLRMDDASGVEGEWQPPESEPAVAVEPAPQAPEPAAIYEGERSVDSASW